MGNATVKEFEKHKKKEVVDLRKRVSALHCGSILSLLPQLDFYASFSTL
jgi:hypothetical protein